MCPASACGLQQGSVFINLFADLHGLSEIRTMFINLFADLHGLSEIRTMFINLFADGGKV